MKVFAIRPLESKNRDLIKLLTPGKIYYLYSDYTILKNDEVKPGTNLPQDFFSQGKRQINIGAIVGKNGSGKSTLIELMFRAINNVSSKYSKIKGNLKSVENVRVEVFFETDGNLYKLRAYDNDIVFFGLNPKNNRLDRVIEPFPLADFFYTIAVNYSLYAYNSLDMAHEGPWIDGLFRKNDGYQTPIVLNPFRDNGNIDMNVEYHLTKSRLIANLARDKNKENAHFRNLGEGRIARFVRVEVKREQGKRVLYTQYNKDGSSKDVLVDEAFTTEDKISLLKAINRAFAFGYASMDKVGYKEVLDYLVYKLVSMATKYFNQDRALFFKGSNVFNSETLEGFLSELATDKTHITLKFRQTINFIKYGHIKYMDHDLDLDELAQEIKKIMAKRLKIALSPEELAPPPIFNTDIFLDNTIQNVKDIPFKSLSSGEKQLIYSTNSFLYHLINVDSVPYSTKNKVAYRHVNIILEEIELYAHPEMQRNFIALILKNIKELQLQRTKSINFCFVTHSPFILTDIPDCNVLFLDETGNTAENSKNFKTFGGNIHELLCESFFLGNGTVGGFAQDKITMFIKTINEAKPGSVSREEREELYNCIKMIGEPFLRQQLMDLFVSKFGTEMKIEMLEEEIKTLKNDQLKKK